LADQQPFTDVRVDADGFTIPELKWRELLFVGALRPEGGAYVRNPSRPLPAFQALDLFPEGVRLLAEREGGRVRVRRAGSGV
jgi:hypothetical protein